MKNELRVAELNGLAIFAAISLQQRELIERILTRRFTREDPLKMFFGFFQSVGSKSPVAAWIKRLNLPVSRQQMP